MWRINETINSIKDRISRNLYAVGEFGVSYSKSIVPVDTGNLKNSIDYKVDEKSLSVTIGTNVEYAPYVEFGTGEKAESGKGRKGGWFYKDESGKLWFTRGQKPQPFLRPIILNKKNQDTIFKLLSK